MNKYCRFFLPRDDAAFDANLEYLSRQGWELASFIGDWHRLPQYTVREDGAFEQIEAVFRRSDNGSQVRP